MRHIAKGNEPPSLTTHRLSPHCDYNNYAAKDDLRDALIREQRGLCCYCMGRIWNGTTTMKIEHWQCQAHHPAEQLNYRNLLGACLGGRGQPGHLQHCDTRRGIAISSGTPPILRITLRPAFATKWMVRSARMTWSLITN